MSLSPVSDSATRKTNKSNSNTGSSLELLPSRCHCHRRTEAAREVASSYCHHPRRTASNSSWGAASNQPSPVLFSGDFVRLTPPKPSRRNRVAGGLSTDGLKPSFYTINGVVYAVQILVWSIIWWKPAPAWVIVSKLFFRGVYLVAALKFLLYGGRFFLMLQRYPTKSKGRNKKLHEVGSVTTVCFLCFLVRSVMMFFDAFGKDADLDDLNHLVLNLLLYYLLMEILPCAVVMFILRKIPRSGRSVTVDRSQRWMNWGFFVKLRSGGGLSPQ